MKLNYIGSIVLPNANASVSECGPGSFLRYVGQLTQDVNRIFNGLQFDWGNYAVSPHAPFHRADWSYDAFINQGGGLSRGGIKFFGDQSFAYWIQQFQGESPAGLLDGCFGTAGDINNYLRADYRTTGQSPGSNAGHTAYLNGQIHSTANGGIVCQPPEFLDIPGYGGINPQADCINTLITFIGFVSPIYALIAVDMGVSTFPSSNGHDILGRPLYPVGSSSSQTQYGGFGLLNLTNGNYEMFGDLFEFDTVSQASHDNGDGTASNGDMVSDLTQTFKSPLKNGDIVSICGGMDVDGNFLARDNRGLVNVSYGNPGASLQYALGLFASPQADAIITAQWTYDIYPGGIFPTSVGGYADWVQTSAGFDYSEYTLQNYNGAPAGTPAPYCVVNGVPDSLVLERYQRPGIPLNYPLPFSPMRGVFYYRGMPCYVIHDTIGAGGADTFDVYIPKNLHYAVAFNGMRNFTRPISPSTGDNIS